MDVLEVDKIQFKGSIASLILTWLHEYLVQGRLQVAN